MSRFIHIGEATLYLGDCRDIFEPVDAIISDPPYGIGYAHGGGMRGGEIGNTAAANKRGSPPIIGDDVPFDPRPLIELSDNVIIWGSDHFYPRLPDYGRFLAWNKLGDMEPWDSFSDVEFAWHSREGASRIFSMKWKGLACDKVGENGGLRLHTTQKPIRLMRWCIDQAKLHQGSTVADFYMGVGTIGIAALQAGHSFIGAEIEPSYFSMACERIENAQRQNNLFT